MVQWSDSNQGYRASVRFHFKCEKNRNLVVRYWLFLKAYWTNILYFWWFKTSTLHALHTSLKIFKFTSNQPRCLAHIFNFVEYFLCPFNNRRLLTTNIKILCLIDAIILRFANRRHWPQRWLPEQKLEWQLERRRNLRIGEYLHNWPCMPSSLIIILPLLETLAQKQGEVKMPAKGAQIALKDN